MTKRIGKYEIQGEIGRGGFGHVYAALDPMVNRLVAIKVLISADDPDVLGRFRAEAEAAGRLRHKNVVTIYDYGEQEGMPYLVMEYLEGQTLQQVLQGTRNPSLLGKMQVMSQVADGLRCAHQSGIVHRDIKPANIMVLRDGTVKIMDFGIARALEVDTTRRTRTGFLIGTLAYMCPEQFQGGPVDHLCDLWAYGVIYYEMLTGVHPFQASDPAALMYRINNVELAPVRTLLPACPEALAAVLQKALAKDRAVRYQSLEDLQYDTEPILIELKCGRASEMVSEARRLLDQGQVDAANGMIRSIFDLDASNRDARELRETIQEQLQWRAIKQRVEALVKSGEECIAQRQFPEAIQMFESALRLDNGDSSIRIRIESAQTAYEQSRRAGLLLADAQLQLDRQDLTAAHRCAVEALRSDPQNPQAGQLLEAINRDIERREHQRQLEQRLATANELLASGRHDAAVGLLIDLNLRYPGTAAITFLLGQAQSQKAEADRKRRMRAELDSARELLDQGRFAEGVRRLERLVSEFEQDESFIALLASARGALKAQEHAEKVGRLAQQARSLLSEGDFGRAVDALVEAVRRYPGEESLAALLSEALRAKVAHDREQVIRRTLRRAEELRKASRFSQALETVDACLRENADVPDLVTARAHLIGELEKLERNKAVVDAKAGASELLNAGRPAEALDLLSDTARYHMASEELAPLIAAAEEAKKDQARAELFRQRVDEASALEAQGRTAEALALLETLSPEHSRASEVAEAVRRLRASRAAEEREKRIQILVRGIEQRLKATDWDGSLHLIRGAQTEFPGDARFAALATRATEGRAPVLSPQLPQAPPIPSPRDQATPQFGTGEQPRVRLPMAVLGAVLALALVAGIWLTLDGNKSATVPKVTASAVSFSYQVGAAAPTPSAVSISSNQGDRFVVRTDAKWITVQQGSSSTVQVSVDPKGLNPGKYSGEVLIQGKESGSAPHHVVMTLEVRPAPTGLASEQRKGNEKPEIVKPQIRLTPASLEFTVNAGDTSRPGRFLDVTTSPDAAFLARATIGEPWIEIRQSHGVSPGRIQVLLNAADFKPGTYWGAVTISTAGSTKTVPVTLKVKVPPSPKAAPFSLKTYGGAKSGRLRWQGELEPGGQLTIQGGRGASRGKILSGMWEEGIPISIEGITPEAVLKQAPTEANHWTAVIVSPKGPVGSLSISWKVKAQ